MDAISPLAHATSRRGVIGGLGGFGALFDVREAGYADPILVAGTDGVGTKLMLAFDTGKHDTIGIDLVAMCANDVLAQGAEPLFFLDYFATGKLDREVAATVIAGIAEGCRRAGCALVGGETAEMPGMYPPGHYDLAGFVVGAAERGNILPRTRDMKAGDLLIGLASSGPHSNGYSLIRQIVAREGLGWNAPAPFDPSRPLGLALLEPTRLYTSLILPLIRSRRVKGLAHITGGGLPGNVPRLCPDHLVPEIDYSAWQAPAVFDWLAAVGGVTDDEMRKTFNLGIGLVICVAENDATSIVAGLQHEGEAPVIIGSLRPA